MVSLQTPGKNEPDKARIWTVCCAAGRCCLIQHMRKLDSLLNTTCPLRIQAPPSSAIYGTSSRLGLVRRWWSKCRCSKPTADRLGTAKLGLPSTTAPDFEVTRTWAGFANIWCFEVEQLRCVSSTKAGPESVTARASPTFAQALRSERGVLTTYPVFSISSRTHDSPLHRPRGKHSNDICSYKF